MSNTQLEQLMQRDEFRILRECLEALPEKFRVAVTLHHLDGLTFPQIADALGCSERSARNWVTGALKRLRRCMEEQR